MSIKAQVINLLEDLRERFGLTYLFIAHDLSVVRHLCQRVAVMYLGRVVELAACDELFDNPLHPYTQALLAAVPVPDPSVEAERTFQPVKGEVPSPMNPPSGCVFHPALLDRGRGVQASTTRAARSTTGPLGRVQRGEFVTQKPSPTQPCGPRPPSPALRVRRAGLLATGLAAAVAATTPAAVAETPKTGGTLTYMIPADAPPSLDGHRETTYATVHTAAPFYSVLVRVNPENPSSTTDFVCDLCATLPKPTDDGRTYIFKIRENVKFHDGSPLTAADVAASWSAIIHPPEGVSSARESYYVMVDTVTAPDPATVVFHLKFATDAFLPALADPFAWIYKKEILEKDQRW